MAQIANRDDADLRGDRADEQPSWPRWLAARIGIVPIPVAILIVILVALDLRAGRVPSDLLTNVATLAVGGFVCAEIGRRIPVLRHVGFPAVVATFLPSYLVYAGLLPKALKDSMTAFADWSNYLYLFIASIIVGSILSMDRRLLVSGFLRLLLPLSLGSIAAACVGCATGTLLGLGLEHTLFKIVVPIMAGGVGEGAIPLTMGYAAVTHQSQGDLFAQVLPPVMFGSFTAILLAGSLNHLGKIRPGLTGNGALQVGEHDLALSGAGAIKPRPEPETVGAALVTIVSLFLVGEAAHSLWGFPGPVVMLGLAVTVKLARLTSAQLEDGAYSVYQFFSRCVTYPLLFGIGVASIRWEKLIAAMNFPTLATIVATVVTLVLAGFAGARLVNMHPIEAAIVNACHSGQGGTGDVAILTAGNRMQLMPYAQIATRIGGAITVILALIAFARLHH